MRGSRRSALGSLLAATALLIGAPGALAQTGADDPGTQAKTTQATVDRANQLRDQACAAAAASAAARDADPTNVEKTAKAAADAADCAAKTANAVKESASLAARERRHRRPRPPTRRCPPTSRTPRPTRIKSDNIEWVSNSRGVART